MSEASGFWSYVHKDDAAEGERISQLARDVVSQYEMISGETISLFLDRDSIEWGEAWRPKVDSALDSVAFFVPILTPRYFKSNECRRELNFFARRASELGMSELIMPIKYVDFPGLTEENPLDDTILLVRSFQWEDWTEIRFCSRASPEYRQAVARLAERMHRANLESEKILADANPLDPAATEDEELGFVDIIARAEQSFPAWSATLEGIGRSITEIGEIMRDADSEIQEGVSAGRAYAARLFVMQKMASKLEDPTARLESLANEYSSLLHDVDEGLSLIFQLIPVEIANETTSMAVINEFSVSISGLAVSTAEALGYAEAMTQNLEKIEGSTRIIRPVVRRLRKSLTLLLEAREVTERWVEKIKGLNLRDNEPPIENN